METYIKTLDKALNLLTNAAKPLTSEPQPIEDAIGRMQPGEELRIPINAVTVAAGLLNNLEEVEVMRLPVIGLAYWGEDELVGDSMITSLVAYLVAIGAEPAVFPANMEKMPGLSEMAEDDELDALVVIGGDSEHTAELIKKARGKVLFSAITAEPLQNIAGGKINGKPVLGIPEDPALCMAAALTMLEPLVMAYFDIPRQIQIRSELITSDAITSNAETTRLIPAELRWKNGIGQVRPVREDDLLPALQKANGWIILPPASPNVTINDIVDFLPLRRMP